MTKKTQTLDFASLIPQHHDFKDVDGEVYLFKSRSEFGAVDYARLQGLHRVAMAAVDRINAEAGDPEEAAQEIENAFRKLTAMLIPTLPGERIQVMSVMQMVSIWEWWQQQEAPKNGAKGEEEGVPDAPAPLAKGKAGAN